MKSPTAIYVDIALRDVPGGPWAVEDDPDSWDILVRDIAGRTWRLRYVNKLSGGWVEGDLPAVLMDEVHAVLPFEHHADRGFRHIEWRQRHRPIRDES